MEQADATPQVTKLTKEEVARLCHEANRAYCLALGDKSQPAWDEAPDWQKESALAGVDLHVTGEDIGPEASHNAWMAQKEADGWKYGVEKDAEKKEHPCMVPFEALPVEQQAKDYIFAAIVKTAVSFVEPVKPQTEAVKQQGVPTPAEPPKPTIRYVGFRDQHRDSLYGTGDWFKGQAKVVPPATYAKMLKHPDVYVDGGTEAVPDMPGAEVIGGDQDAEKQGKKDEEATQAARDAIAAMTTKEAVADYVMANFRQKVPRTLNLENMKRQATMLIDQYGA